MEHRDIAVIGAGPAGAAVAIQAARHGARVVMFDKAPCGRDKVCGDGLTPRAVTALHDLGIALDDAHLIEGLRMIANKTERELPWPAGGRFAAHGAVWPRRRLDAYLVAAAEEAGAEVIWETEALPVFDDDGSVIGVEADGTRWIDGPLTRAVKFGGICYLDEIVEARKDTTVIIHPLTDHRRSLTIDKLGSTIDAADGFLLVVSYNPGYQNALKDLKHSTRQRFVALEFDFPDEEHEAQIIAHESGCEPAIAERLARLGVKIRNLREHGLEEGASTRMLIYAGRLIKEGVSHRRACQVSVTWGITDDPQIQRSIDEVVTSIFA